MKYAQIEWNNGTPRSARFGDVYFSAGNGVEETRHVFLQQNELPQRWKDSDHFVIAETGFGTGLNFLVYHERVVTVSTGECLSAFHLDRKASCIA